MPQNLQTPIPPMTEEDRSLRAEFEREWLKQSLVKLKSQEIDTAELCNLMQHYCQLKKEDNAKDKNFVSLAIAEARLSRRLRLRAIHDLPAGASQDSPLERKSPLVRDSHLAPTLAGIPSRVPSQSRATDDASFNTAHANGSPTDPTTLPLGAEHSEFDPNDPDVDPEWIAAPWGRRRNGKPRTEKEYRTILYRGVRDIYGLDLRDADPDPNPTPKHATTVDHTANPNHATNTENPLNAPNTIALHFRARSASECGP